MVRRQGDRHGREPKAAGPRTAIPTDTCFCTQVHLGQQRRRTVCGSTAARLRSSQELEDLQKDIDEHGATDGCLGCRAIVRGLASRAGHSPACRARLKEFMMQTEEGSARVARASERATRDPEPPSSAAQEGGGNSGPPAARDTLPPPALPVEPQTLPPGRAALAERLRAEAISRTGASYPATAPRGVKRSAEVEPDDPRLTGDGPEAETIGGSPRG